MIKVGGWSTTCPNSRCVRQTSLPAGSLLHCFTHCGCSPTRSSFTGPVGAGWPEAVGGGFGVCARAALALNTVAAAKAIEAMRIKGVVIKRPFDRSKERLSLAASFTLPSRRRRDAGARDAQRRLGALFPYPPRQSNKN